MHAIKDLPPISPIQRQTVTFDYGDFLQPGVTITSAVVTITVVTGTDPDPTSRLVGGVSVVTPPKPFGSGIASAGVAQVVNAGCIDGCRYQLTCLATLTSGDTPPLVVEFDCQS